MNRVTRSLIAALALAMTSYAVQPATAGDGKCGGGKGSQCSHCGIFGCDCCTVCRLVKTEKELTVDCWSSQCKGVCLPGPSTRGCKHSELACVDGKCGSKGSKGSKGCGSDIGLCEKKFVWYDWIPGSSKSRCKKVLMRKESTIIVPAYKWVVEDLCSKCDAKVKGANIKAGDETLIPEPPKMDEAQLRYGNPLNLPVKFERTRSDTEGSPEVAKVFAGSLK